MGGRVMLPELASERSFWNNFATLFRPSAPFADHSILTRLPAVSIFDRGVNGIMILMVGTANRTPIVKNGC